MGDGDSNRSNGRAVVIGASTGGPEVLHAIIRSLPTYLPFPIFVAQHMIPEIMKTFADSLNSEHSIRVELANQDQEVENSVVYVAQGGSDTKVVYCADNKIRLINVESLSTLQPSVDVLMASVATVYRDKAMGIILTGMGKDGLEGMRAIKSLGGKTLVQDKATSTVYGMAKAVEEEHLADSVLPLSAIADAIVGFGGQDE